MISTCLNKLTIIRLIGITILGVLLLPYTVVAQGSITLSVSPTLFDMTASPTQQWTSNVRVINANEVPLQIYVDVVNFEPNGEGGQGSLTPLLADENEGATLAEWITVEGGNQLIPAEQTVSIPFTINVPEDAAPGGHFAAILIGTRSFDSTGGAAQVETSQVVTALVFLRVAGDIIESGQIRDFTTSKLISEAPAMDFSLRFENTGNVHLQPQGAITITNMWGKEREVLPINQNSQFGNVLPESVRKYTFNWTGDWSIADMGRYKAVASLVYGEEDRNFADSTTTFWVIPWRALLFVLALVGGLGWLIVWGIKLYIRRMLQLAGVTPELHRDQRHRPSYKNLSITAPIEEGILDLRFGLRTGEGSFAQKILHLAKAYRVFLIVAVAVVIFIGLFIWYLIMALSADRGYEVSYERNGVMVPVESSADTVESMPIVVDTLPQIQLVNRSGAASVTDRMTEKLREQGYDVLIDDAAQPVIEDRTVIVYDPSLTGQITRLQALFDGALLSSFVVENPTEPQVTIYIGSDQLE